MTVIALPLFLLLLAMALPIGYALLGASSIGIALSGSYPLSIAAQRFFDATQSSLLLAIPFFILAGELLIAGTLGQRIIHFAGILVGRVRGALGQVSVVTSMLFAGVSGSAVADASALGSVLIPWQKREGYPAPFAAAVNSASSVIGVIIPPSIPLIIYSSVSQVSVGALFLAGIIPGLIFGGASLVAVYLIARRGNFPRSDQPFAIGPVIRGFFASLPALLMPVIILGALIGGIATPTEISVIAVFYALVVRVCYRDLTPRGLLGSVLSAGQATGAVLLLIMASSVLGWVMTVDQLPSRLVDFINELGLADVLVIVFMNLLMLLVGAVIDMTPAILLLAPIMIPLAESIDMSLIQLGIMMVLNLAIGLFTPPVGTTLFISSSIAGVRIEQTARALVPFYIFALLVLVLVSYVPALFPAG
ncbi:TRAP transporter large permease [Kushneria indalinina]|uniref:TRAP transporter large permease protein n=1 Tax=Kushneria indalinina DSM 14324 TaxID=1122140 RepID=A0A3D9DX40_9GAMM|nr:TRAP transporter large permease [Kushneria indalinina]REC95350.1 tripartite ATP-independent transporter DctM subunit [Kushneria indalinina DSM 14324]